MAEIAAITLDIMGEIRGAVGEIEVASKQVSRLVSRLDLFEDRLLGVKNGLIESSSALYRLRAAASLIHMLLTEYAQTGIPMRALRREADFEKLKLIGVMLAGAAQELELEYDERTWAEEDKRDSIADLEDLLDSLEEMERKCRDIDREEVSRASRTLCREQRSRIQGWIEVDFAKDLDFEGSVNLGSGSFGTVLTAKWRGTKVAVKHFMASAGLQREAIRALRKRVRVHADLPKNNFIVPLYAASTVKPDLCLVTELAPSGSLQSYVRASSDPLEDSLQLAFLYDIARGMRFLHKRGILHGDLKSSNVLVYSNGRLKVCDFGLSKILKTEMSSPSGRRRASTSGSSSGNGITPWSSPEEMHKNPAATKLSDVYSFGVICYEIATRTEPFAGMNPRDLIRAVRVQQKRPQIPERHSPPNCVKRLMENCWRHHPGERPQGFTPVIRVLSGLVSCVGDPRKSRASDTRARSSSEADYARNRKLARDANRRAMSLFEEGKLDEAELFFRTVLAIDARMYGTENTFVATDLNNLGSVLRDQGRYEDADELYQQAIEVGEQTLGPDHPDVATRLNNRAGLLATQGKFSEAIRLLERALTIFSKTLGQGHDHTIRTMQGLWKTRQKQKETVQRSSARHVAAVKTFHGPPLTHVGGSTVYSISETCHKDEGVDEDDGFEQETKGDETKANADRFLSYDADSSVGPKGLEETDELFGHARVLENEGMNEEAAHLYDQSKALSEGGMGRENPRVASELNRRAAALMEQGKFAQAHNLYASAADMIGEESPSYPTALNKLAVSLHEQGKYSEAQELLEKSRDLLEERLGPDHPDVAQTLKNLGDVFEAQGEYVDAEIMYEKYESIFATALGPEHPLLADVLISRANLMQQQGRYADAELLLAQAVTIGEKDVGNDHPDFARALNHKAELLRTMGRYIEADPLFLRAIDIGERKLGDHHPSLAMWLNNRAELLRQQGRLSEADTLYLRAVEIGEKTLGVDHPQLSLWIHNRAGLLKAMGRLENAEELYERAQGMRERLLGPEHPMVAESLNSRAILLIQQGRMDEANSMLERAIAIGRKTRGPHHPRMASFLNNRAWLLTLQGKREEARSLFNRALGILRLTVGKDHPQFAVMLENRAYLLIERGNLGEALPLLERILAIKKMTLGEDHEDTIEVQRVLERERANERGHLI